MGCKAGPKVVGGACMVEDVVSHHMTAEETSGLERSNMDTPCTGVLLVVNNSSLVTEGRETKHHRLFVRVTEARSSLDLDRRPLPGCWLVEKLAAWNISLEN